MLRSLDKIKSHEKLKFIWGGSYFEMISEDRKQSVENEVPGVEEKISISLIYV